MKLSELANTLAQRVKDVIGQDAAPIMTNKDMAQYGRKLEPGCVAIRVLIVANEELGDLGKMELFVPVNKKRLKEAPDSVLASVLRFIQASAQYRADMIGKARERVEA